MSITNTLKHVAENSNGKMIIRKVSASKQPSSETINKIEAEISSMIRENDKVAYDSMHPRKNYYSTGTKNGRIENFEEKYAKLLEGIDKEELVPLPNPHEGDIVTTIDEIDHLEDGFIARYCLGEVDVINTNSELKFSLDKDKSNKVAKVVTTIILMAGLSLANPINVNASENIKTIEAMSKTDSMLFKTIIDGLIIGSTLLGIATIKEIKKGIDINLGSIKLDKENEIEELVKYLKPTIDKEK